MVNAIGTANINPIKMFNALSAFKATDAQSQTQQAPEIAEGLDVNDNILLQNQNLDEIKEFAKVAGENNLSNEDIKYGLTYGRSVIADYSA